MSYAEDHASAVADVADAGTTVTFTHVTPGTYDASTDTWTDAVDASVSGYAVQDRADPEQYRSLNLVEGAAVTLFFTPSTYGDKPAIGSTVSWDSETWNTRAVSPVAPDGTAIGCYVVVSR